MKISKKNTVGIEFCEIVSRDSRYKVQEKFPQASFAWNLVAGKFK